MTVVCLMSTASSPSQVPFSMASIDVMSGLQLPAIQFTQFGDQLQQQQEVNIETLIRGLSNTAFPMEVTNPMGESSAFTGLGPSSLPSLAYPCGLASTSLSSSTPFFLVSQLTSTLPSSLTASLTSSLGQSFAPTSPLALSSFVPLSGSETVTPTVPRIITPAVSLSPPMLPPPHAIFRASSPSQPLSPLQMDELDVPSTSYYRRLSAPETRRPVERVHEKRRYSDFSIDALLRQPAERRLHRAEERKASARKQRTIYGLKQTEVLEEAFHTQRYMVGAEREMLASRLGLSEAQVRVWFQNRRSKQRKLSKMASDPQPGPSSGFQGPFGL